jgi:GTP-binding protein HflX
VDCNADGHVSRIDVSALRGLGLEELKEAIALRLKGERIRTWVTLGGAHARLRSQLFDLGAVREEKVGNDGQWLLRLELSRQDAEQLGRLPGAEGMLVRDSILNPHIGGVELAGAQGET